MGYPGGTLEYIKQIWKAQVDSRNRLGQTQRFLVVLSKDSLL